MKIEDEKSFDDLANKDYKYGFVTENESESLPPGLSEEIVVEISKRKNEPSWLTEWRLKAYNEWKKMEAPQWAKVDFPEIDYDSIQYYSVPKTKKKLGSLDDADPELLKTFEKSLWIAIFYC